MKGRYEIIDTHHPKWRGQRFTKLVTAQRELGHSFPPGRFVIKDRETGKAPQYWKGFTMRIETLSGAVGIPTFISNKQRVNDDGIPYYFANVIIDGTPLVAGIHADKAWRVREYLATMGDTT